MIQQENIPSRFEIPDAPVTENLLRAAEMMGERGALIYGGIAGDPEQEGRLLDTQISYANLATLAQRFGAGLQALGLQAGQRVALHLPNCPQFVIAYYGTLLAGGIVVPHNPRYVAREMKHQLRDAGATFIVTSYEGHELVDQIHAGTALERIIVADTGYYLPKELAQSRCGREQELRYATCGFQEVLQASPADLQPVCIDMEDTAVLMYTRGTTGVAKGAQLTHRNVQANAAQFGTWLFLTYGAEAILTSLPLFHSYGMTTCMNVGIWAAASIVLIPDARDLTHILESINRHRPSIYPGVPALYMALINAPGLEQYDIRSIRACVSGAAPLPPDTQRRFQALTGGKLVEGYGLSEASPVTHANPIRGENRIGTIGLPMPLTEARIVALETGDRELPHGEPGELVIRGPQVMKAYWRMPDETRTVLRDGWLHTGDVATMDADGYVHVVDRKKDMILAANGLNVYPREVEEVLMSHPGVCMCAVVGVPSPDRGEVVQAFIVAEPGHPLSEEDILSFCRQELSAYKVPRRVMFRDSLPMSAVGKTLRRVLAEEARKTMSAPDSEDDTG